MSRVLKRPMFKMGGSTENSGIMDGMRQRYAESDPKGVQPMTPQEAIAELDRRAPSPNFGRSAFLRDFGLNLLATPPQGNIFQTAAVAARDPVARFDAAKARSAASRREIMAQLMGQERQFGFDRDLQRERLDAQREIAGIETQKKTAIDNFPQAGNPVVALKLQTIVDADNAVNSPGQIVPDGQNIVKTIQNLNPDAGLVFALYSPLTGDVTKFVRVEKEKNNRIKLAEVDADGNDLPGNEGDAPEETEDFTGFPTYKQDPKPNIFKDLEDKSDFKAFDEPGA
jgi:hypothetical protein